MIEELDLRHERLDYRGKNLLDSLITQGPMGHLQVAELFTEAPKHDSLASLLEA